VITLEDLSSHYHLPLNTVAKKFGLCLTALKKTCRRYNITRWPHRKVREDAKPSFCFVKSSQVGCRKMIAPETTRRGGGGNFLPHRVELSPQYPVSHARPVRHPCMMPPAPSILVHLPRSRTQLPTTHLPRAESWHACTSTRALGVAHHFDSDDGNAPCLTAAQEPGQEDCLPEG
jgi:hypothetical protein